MQAARGAEQVSAVNRRFYDSIAPVYDQIDARRRGVKNPPWLCNVLKNLQELSPEGSESTFLDAGSGSGFLSYAAQSYFKNIVLLDISQKMLGRIEIPSAVKLVANCFNIPLADCSISVVGAFATLHHLYDPIRFFAESYRILKPGGILYVDHDIEQQFVSRFRLPLRFYRIFFDHGHDYLKACPHLTEQEYKLTEFHGDTGLNGRHLVEELQELGLEVICEKYHWEGMGPLADLLRKFGLTKVLDGRGRSPVVRLIARKR